MTDLETRFGEIEALVESRIDDAVDEKQHPYLRGTWKSRILPSLRVDAQQRALSPEAYRALLLIVLDVVVRMNDATHVYGRYDPARPEHFDFWKHQPIDLIRAGDETRGIGIGKAELSDAASRYVKRPEVQNAPVDWYLMDMLAFAELDAFADQVVAGVATGTMNWAGIFAQHSQIKYFLYTGLFWFLGFFIRYVAPPAAAFYIATLNHEYIAITIGSLWIGYVALRLVTFPGRWKARKKALEQLQLMIDVYMLLGQSVISPTRLRDAINKAHAAGVVYDGALFAIVDRLIKRDDTAFVPFH